MTLPLAAQVRRVWEVLLFMQPGCQTTRGMRLLEELVQGRIEAQHSHTNTEQLCQGKRLIDLNEKDEEGKEGKEGRKGEEDDEEEDEVKKNWIMYRAAEAEGALAARQPRATPGPGWQPCAASMRATCLPVAVLPLDARR